MLRVPGAVADAAAAVDVLRSRILARSRARLVCLNAGVRYKIGSNYCVGSKFQNRWVKSSVLRACIEQRQPPRRAPRLSSGVSEAHRSTELLSLS